MSRTDPSHDQSESGGDFQLPGNGVGRQHGASLGAGRHGICRLTPIPRRAQVYYIGVKSEDQMAAEYGFMPVFTAIPFSQLDQNGNQIVNGLLLPMNIPDGNTAHPGVTNVFALAIYPMQVAKVIVTNLDEHQNFGDLFGALTFGGTVRGAEQPRRLRQHLWHRCRWFMTTAAIPSPARSQFRRAGQPDEFPRQVRARPVDFDRDGQFADADRPGQPVQPAHPAAPRSDQPGVIVTVPPDGWFIDYVDVPPGYTNLTFYATNLHAAAIRPAADSRCMKKFGNEPTLDGLRPDGGPDQLPDGAYPTG